MKEPLSHTSIPALAYATASDSLDSFAAQATTLALRAQLERALARAHADEECFTFPGICQVDDAVVEYRVDREWGARTEDGLWLPNWRERTVCPRCGLNSRQRAMTSAVLSLYPLAE